MGRWVCLDVGETLIDETRVWGTWADVLGIPRLTFMAALGAAVERGWDYRHVFEIVDAPDWRRHLEAVERRYGGFRGDDLYPDALTAIDGLRDRGFRVAIVANQPASRTGELRALGFDIEVMAMSEELGVAKPAGRILRSGTGAAGRSGSLGRGVRRRSHRQRCRPCRRKPACARSGCDAAHGASSRARSRRRPPWS